MKVWAFFILISVIASEYAFSTVDSEFGEGSIKGIVYDTIANLPLEYATISMFNLSNDSLIGGTISNSSGLFKLKNIRYGVYKINITFIGYEVKSFDKVILDKGNSNIDLGKIYLSPAVETLGEAVVVSEKPDLIYKIDKKIIVVDEFYKSGVGTAINVLENYPSITVDFNGNVSLRGSTSFKVLIDGKPTILKSSDALRQIPASNIENIEIITNPSAKYDPEGTSGIINIITKKKRLEGFTGIVKLTGGMYGYYGADLLFSEKKKKTGYFIGAHINQEGTQGNVRTESQTKLNDTTSFVIKDGDFASTRYSNGIRGGFDFNLSANDFFSIQGIVGEWEAKTKFNVDFNSYTQPEDLIYLQRSKDENIISGLYYNADLNYTHKFNEKGHELSALVYFSRKDFDDSDKNTLKNSGDAALVAGYKSIEKGPTDLYNFQIDYVVPLSDKNKLEAGYKSEINNYNITGEVNEYNAVLGVYELNTDYLYNVKFDKDIHAVYSTFSGNINKFGYQLGLRAEYTYRKMYLEESSEGYLINRFDYFPGIHLSCELPKKQQLMASLTRRINRPDNWQIEPFYTWNDPYNVRIGNPALNPEYINSYEISYLKRFEKMRISAEFYYKKVTNAFERVRTVYSKNIIENTYENIGSNKSLGAELSLNLSYIKWWNIMLVGNLYNYSIKGELYNQKISNSSYSWTSRLQNVITLGKNTRLLTSTMYSSKSVTPQGVNDGYFITNITYNQKFLKNFTATLQCTGIFGAFERVRRFEGDDFSFYQKTVPNTPVISLTISYLINNYKYDRKKHKTGGLDEGEGSGL